MSEPRQHHIVPKFYLKRFADKKERVVMVSRDQKKRLPPMKAEKVCRELDFYSIITNSAHSSKVEGFLGSEIEDKAKPALENILSGNFPPTSKTREAIALFVAFQALRGHEIRDAFKQLSDHIAQVIESRTTTTSPVQPTSPPNNQNSSHTSNSTQNAHTTSSKMEIQNDSILLMMKTAPGIANTILARKWFIFDHAEPCLLTSDSPVITWSDPNAENPYGTSLTTADQIILPLSSRHSLIMLYESQTPERLIKPGSIEGPKLAHQFNFRIATGASKWIFHHPEIDPLKDVVLPPKSAPLIIG